MEIDYPIDTFVNKEKAKYGLNGNLKQKKKAFVGSENQDIGKAMAMFRQRGSNNSHAQFEKF